MILHPQCQAIKAAVPVAGDAGSAPVRRLRIGAGLGKGDAEALETLIGRRVRSVPARGDIAPEGSATDRVHFVLRGWACRYVMLEDGRRQIVSVLLPGDACCLDQYLPARLDHCIAPLSRLDVSEVPRSELLSAARERPGLAAAFGWAEAVARGVQRQWAVNLGRRTARERVAHLLCEIHHRLRGAGLAGPDSFQTRLTQVDMADALGLSSVHVNRTVGELRKEGIIRLDTRRVEILDHGRLARAAQFDPGYLDAPVRGPGGFAGPS